MEPSEREEESERASECVCSGGGGGSLLEMHVSHLHQGRVRHADEAFIAQFEKKLVELGVCKAGMDVRVNT